jgi:hypothetical protein
VAEERSRLRRLGWFVLIWLLSALAVAGLAYGVRALLLGL